MRIAIVGALPAALALCGADGGGQDARLLLGGQSGIAQSADDDDDDRHQRRRGRSSTTSSSSRPARPRSRPALAESLGDLGRRHGIHVPSAPRREVPLERARSRRRREMNADDVLFSLERQWKEDHPYHGVSGANYDYFKDMGMPELLKSIEKLDDYTVRFRLTRPEAPFLADLAMPFNVVQSAEYADQLLQAGTPEKFDARADRHRPVRLRRLPAGRGGPLPRLRRLLGRQAADRHAGLLHHAERRRAAHQAEGRRMPRHGLSRARTTAAQIEADPNLKFLRAGGAQHRLSRAEHDAAALRRCARAPRHQHGDRQGGDHRGGLSGRRRRREEPDPADALVLQRRHRGLSLRSGRGAAADGRGRARRRASTPTSGTCRSAGPTIRTASASPR